jgi:hypothetical protein
MTCCSSYSLPRSLASLEEVVRERPDRLALAIAGETFGVSPSSSPIGGIDDIDDINGPCTATRHDTREPHDS